MAIMEERLQLDVKAWLTLPSLEDKDPLPDSSGSAIYRLFGLEVASTAELLRLGVPGKFIIYI